MSPSAPRKFRDYPKVFRAFALLDALYFIALVGFFVYGVIANPPVTVQEGFLLGYSIKGAMTLAFALVFWRYRIRTVAANRQVSVSLLFLALIVLWALPA